MEKTWEETLDNIRHASEPILISDDGMPRVAAGAQYFEIAELLKALAEGYNRSFSKAAAFRKACRNAVSNWRDE